jgi:hypothetical protein
MEPEGSCLEEPTIGPYPEPEQSSPYHPLRSMTETRYITYPKTLNMFITALTPPAGAEVKKTWIYASTPPYVFMA